MDLFTVILIAIGLAMDAFAVSLAVGTNGLCNNPRVRFRLWWHFGFFQFLMPILGWLAGTSVARYIEKFDHWVAFGLLAYIGGNMIRSGLKPDVTSFRSDPSKGKLLITLAIATSIDALAVGLSMAMLRVRVIFPAIVIGIVAMLFSVVGLFIGNKLGKKFGKRMEVIGGLILIGIGLRVLITHLF